MIKELIKKIVNSFKNLIKEIKKSIERKKNEWTLCLYLNGVLVDKKKVDENFEPMEHFYKVSLINKKHIIGTNKLVKILCRFDKYKMTDETNKELHIEVKVDEGVVIRWLKTWN